MVAPNNTFDRLYRAMRQVDPNNEDGAWTLAISGGGAGGTSSTDSTAFTPGATSVTPVGGYYGGRTVASGRTAALAINGSGVLQVDVISTSAAAGAAFASVAVYGSPANPVYVQGTVNLAGGAAPFASVAVYGSPAMPVYVVGSVNVQGSLGVGNLGGSVGVTQITSPWLVVGSINPVGVFAPAGSVNVLGSVNIVPPPNMTVWLANQNAGAGFASVAVYGSPTMPVYTVGSVNVVNAVGIYGSASVVGSVNIVPPPNMTVWLANQNAGAGYASVAVYGSPTMPVYAVGSVNVVNAVGIFGSVNVVGSVGVTPLASFTVNMGNIPTVNLGLGTVNIGNAHGIFGSVSILGSVNIGGAAGIFGSVSVLGSVNLGTGAIVGIFGSVSVLGSMNLGGVGVVDTRGSLVPTQWIISTPASGQYLVAGSAPANLRNYLSAFHLVATGTVDFQWQSPSGVAISGSMRLLPGAGFAMAGAFPNGPVLIGSQQSALYIMSTGTQNIGGIAQGWVA